MGHNAFILGKPRSSNPYTQFSISYLDWAKGWDEAKAKWVKEARAKSAMITK
jgi:ribosome modulation factor